MKEAFYINDPDNAKKWLILKIITVFVVVTCLVIYLVNLLGNYSPMILLVACGYPLKSVYFLYKDPFKLKYILGYVIDTDKKELEIKSINNKSKRIRLQDYYFISYRNGDEFIERKDKKVRFFFDRRVLKVERLEKLLSKIIKKYNRIDYSNL